MYNKDQVFWIQLLAVAMPSYKVSGGIGLAQASSELSEESGSAVASWPSG